MALALVIKQAILALVLVPWFSLAMDVHDIRQLAAQYNVSCLLVFGDSSVDSGNNNVLPTMMKSNFPPYGKDFFNGHPTGRFSNGRLASDFIGLVILKVTKSKSVAMKAKFFRKIYEQYHLTFKNRISSFQKTMFFVTHISLDAAEAVGYRRIVPAFLDPNLKPSDLPHGVSFASAASGYDDFTANISSVLPVSKQLEYFEHYKIHLRKQVGVERAEFIVRNALYIISMGTNDFLQNYFLDPTRPKQFSMPQFQNLLLSRFSHTIQGMHKLGAKRIVVVGVPPMGCMPLAKALQNKRNCVPSLNRVSSSFNTRLLRQLAILKAKLGLKTAYVDVYNSILNVVSDPKKHGFEEGSKGCCGTGTVEYGESCRGMETCSDPSKYVFWDAVHPTEMMYKIVADAAIHSVARELTS